MRTLRHDRHGGSSLDFNATPLIDVIFTLTIFVMLVSTFSSMENMPVDLPSPEGSQAKEHDVPDRVVINCLPVSQLSKRTGGARYSIGPNAPEALDVLGDRLAAMKEQNAAMQVVIRADKHLAYSDVRALMNVLAERQIAVLNVAARTRDGE